jgi:hypothetical protein
MMELIAPQLSGEVCGRRCKFCHGSRIHDQSWNRFFKFKLHAPAVASARTLQGAGRGACGGDAMVTFLADGHALIENLWIVGLKQFRRAAVYGSRRLLIRRAGGREKSQGEQGNKASHEGSSFG